ncbi:SH3 domain-containing protein [uncultured Roseobacter sp.]|uniref:SH3 domain-containing protein n=1 Tax=uncultured Roseobacter sp. TaxID=114847 RepID=UPI0026084C2C|nr:SH3 domain-containing protein [uncultured Roseobacter sp.]
MNRFILISFGVLGFGFYELSGGSDFDPKIVREQAVVSRTGGEAAPDQQSTVVAAAPEAPRGELQPVSLNLVSFGEAQSGPSKRKRAVSQQQIEPAIVAEEPSIEPVREEVILAAVARAEPATASDRDVVLASASANAATIPSIIFSGSTSRASSSDVGAQRDIRSVNGSVVNMRSGPGTRHGVVDQLTQGMQVEVLQDSGTGWVELRTSDGSRGWMADFLLSPL